MRSSNNHHNLYMSDLFISIGRSSVADITIIGLVYAQSAAAGIFATRSPRLDKERTHERLGRICKPGS
jgi:hypothetical protein